jgi:hypothetical protein
MLATRGAQVSHDLREAARSGVPVATALEKANVKAEKIEPFSLAEEMDPEEAPKEPKQRAPDFIAIANAVATLQPGEVSEFVPWEADGGIVAILEKRELPDDTKFAVKRATFDQRALTERREVVFYEWLHERQQEAGLVVAKS